MEFIILVLAFLVALGFEKEPQVKRARVTRRPATRCEKRRTVRRIA